MANPSIDNSSAAIPGTIRDAITGALLVVNADGSINAALSGGGTGTATATAGAATLNQYSGVITSEALVGATTYTLTLTNSKIASTSTVLVNATDSASLPATLTSVTPGTHSVVIVVGMAALTGTVKIAFAVFN